MKNIIKHTIVCIALVATAMQAKAQDPKAPKVPTKPVSDSTAAMKKADSLYKVFNAMAQGVKIGAYNTVITKDFETMRGMFTIHKNKLKDQWYFEIPDSLIGRDLLVVTRLGKMPSGTTAFAGEEVEERAMRFAFGPDSLLELNEIGTALVSDQHSRMAGAVAKADHDQVQASFAIAAYGPGKRSYVVDATKFLDGTPTSFINQVSSNLANIIGIASSMRVVYAHAYPDNVDVRIRKSGSPGLAMKDITSEQVTVETVTSFVALPKVPMMPRYFDDRVGYMPSKHTIFTDDQQSVEEVTYTGRFRLEPRPEDMQKWKSGQVVEPQKPIIIYIDPATPKQWRPFLIAGINDWQKAFEQAGFKNAIIGKEWPENDTTMHMDDARYSMVNYFPSEIANAYGPQTIDPRSGEVIQTRIGWFHNVMQLVRDWYLTQAGANDPEARHARFSDELMGQLIRFVSSHEVGHTLGLRHNMLTSNFTPVDSLRSQNYLEKYGHTGSIMDYARFNYVAQPEDHIKQAQLWPHIGEYDRWAIEWGYGPVNATNSKDAMLELSKRTTERLKQNPRLLWAEAELNQDGSPLTGRIPLDPRAVSEVLSDNPMKANTYGIKNLQRATQNLIEWTRVEDGDMHDLKAGYQEIQNEYRRYLGHAKNFITGVYYNPVIEGQPGAVYTPVPKEMQLEALDFVNKQLFTTPYWLLNEKIREKVKQPATPDIVETVQASMLNSLLSSAIINRLLDSETRYGSKVLPVQQYLDNIHSAIWTELETGSPVTDIYRRNMQRAYVANLVKALKSKDAAEAETEVSLLLRADAQQVRTQIKKALQQIKDQVTIDHLSELKERLSAVLDINKGGKTS